MIFDAGNSSVCGNLSFSVSITFRVVHAVVIVGNDRLRPGL